MIVKGVTIINRKVVSNRTVISVDVSTSVVVNVSIVSIVRFLCCNNNKKCSLKKKVSIQLNPDNSNLQGKSKMVRVIEGKIGKKMTWREIRKGSS